VLIDELMPANGDLDPTLREQVQATAAGSPLFVEEILALMDLARISDSPRAQG